MWSSVRLSSNVLVSVLYSAMVQPSSVYLTSTVFMFSPEVCSTTSVVILPGILITEQGMSDTFCKCIETPGYKTTVLGHQA